MRWDDLPQSDNVEDRRGEEGGGYGGGGFGLPIGGGGLGIGTIVVLGLIGWALGIDPRVLIGGAEILTAAGGYQQPYRPRPARAEQRAPHRHADRRDRQVRRRASSAAPRSSGRRSSARPGRPTGAPILVMYRGETDARPAAAWRRARWDRSIARPTRRSISTPRSSARSRQRFRGCSRQGLPVRPGLCDRARGRPSRAEPARHPAEGAAARSAAMPSARRRTSCRSRSSCRPTASPASGRTTTNAETGKTSSSRATSTRRCRPRPRSATTRCRSRRAATWCPTPSPTARSEQRQRWFTDRPEGGNGRGLQHVPDRQPVGGKEARRGSLLRRG